MKKINEQLQEYMSFKFIIGFVFYPLLVALLPFKTVLTPLLSIGTAIIALIPISMFLKEVYIDKTTNYKDKLQGAFLERFFYYNFLLSGIFLVKSFIYAYFGVVYLVIGIVLLIYILTLFTMTVLKDHLKDIWFFIRYNSPIICTIVIACIFNALGLKGTSISMGLFIVLMIIVYGFAFIRIVKSIKYKALYKESRISKFYLAIVPITFIITSLLMMHTYYVTHYYYFMAMLISSIIMYLTIMVISVFTLKKEDKRYFKTNWTIYLFFIPAAIFAIIFAYIPMLGILLAFKDYNIHLGSGPIEAFFFSKWVGFEHFKKLFEEEDFVLALKNTLLISTYKIVFVFPLPIFLAILINEVRIKLYKSSIQTLVYLPHFISWAIVGGIFYGLLATNGPVNTFMVNLGLMDDSARIVWYNRPDLFQGVLVVSYAWKEVGYSAIVYLAAIVGIDPVLYEAARVDGASKLKQITNITLPGLAPTIIMLFVLRLGYILEAGFDQVIVMANENVRDVSEIIGTYVFRIGVQGSEFSFATAVGLFNSVVALCMILLGNFITKKFFNRGIW